MLPRTQVVPSADGWNAAAPAADTFGLHYGQAEQRIAESVITWIRRAYPLLPDRLRYVGPYQEAMARLSGRVRPDLLNQLANQFWIGQRTLDDGRSESVSDGL